MTILHNQSVRAQDLSFADKAIAAWVLVPDWVEELAKAADEKGLKGAAKLIGYTAGLVSAVVHNKYAGDLIRVEGKVRGALMGSVVWCHGVGGEMARDVCLDWQRKPRASTSGHRMRMYRACRDNCPHFRAQNVKATPADEGGADERQ